MGGDSQHQIRGYEDIRKEIELRGTFGVDCIPRKGMWRDAVERLHPKRLKLRVSEIHKETDSVATLRLVADDRPLPPFQAGQHITVLVEIDGVRTGRPYSISSSPCQTAYYDITVKRAPHGFVSSYLLDRVRVGDVLVSTGPAGHFHYNPLFHGKNLVFMAGGGGITPFMSMIREVTDRGLDRTISLLYGCRTPQEAIFHEELTARARRHANFTYTPVISEPAAGCTEQTGFLDADLVKKLGISIDTAMFYLCGPGEMYGRCVPDLHKLGVPGRRIRQEVYGPGPGICDDPAWPADVAPDDVFSIRIAGGRTIAAPVSESLLVAMERAGMTVEHSCRSGRCSLCRVKVISGKVFQASGSLVRKSDRAHGYVHACSAYPLSDLEILL
ncbi:MAG: 2Fe-2S iron-sulfur cluster binding domain-containing protein [Spirochaetes bacterium]|nr:2Fe-2S iron-sulfur cluster binding domain-containing protein [Spirochaetota bacterium]